ncbi:hypothetical protein DBV15_08989 [Temnothorax longispinosus]|uniref:Uncharacterized protein n=1 Tax=Temnothorax longispinosus TaxID=300112 RepID=A0A4S2JM80_9HYME|nr:hypothetical protein DBV15_08989 [Temnothorax longispinosus]
MKLRSKLGDRLSSVLAHGVSTTIDRCPVGVIGRSVDPEDEGAGETGARARGRKRAKSVGLIAGASCVVKLHQFSARKTGQESPRAFKGLNETGTFKEEGFYEREILQQTVCTHLTDQYTSEDVARTKLPCYIPVCLFIPHRAKTFAAITQLKLEATLLSGLSLKKE